MKIFLCWSRDRGKKLAEALKEFLVSAVPILTERDIFFSPEITKGSDWFEDVRAGLAKVNAAVICLTPESVQSPWMHFEAGAVLGRVGKARVFPYLFGVRPEDLQGPLAAFQATVNNEHDTRGLTEALCKIARTEVPVTYEKHWKKLRGRMEELKVERVSEVVPNFAELFQRKTFDEPLKECTHQTWGDRYTGARETQKALAESKGVVGRVCEPHQKELFNRLVSTVDGYAGLLKGFLLEEKRFSYTAAGEVDFTRTPEGNPYPGGVAISAAAERRLKQIKQLVYLLDSAAAAAVLPEAVAFSRMSVHAERKEVVRARQKAIREGKLTLTQPQLSRCQESIWELDRIAYYLTLEHSKRPAAKTLTDSVMGEIERLKAREDNPSAMPLHYALRALLAPKVVDDYAGLGALIEEVEKYLEENKRDGGGQIRANLKKLRAAAAAGTEPRTP